MAGFVHTPLAYFITFRAYGTWLHGDARGSVAFRRNMYGTPPIPASPLLESRMRGRMPQQPQRLDAARRDQVLAAIEEVIKHRDWLLHAVAVRSNHVHTLVTADVPPERVLSTFKAWATRHLRAHDLVGPQEKVWSHHGSTRYVWKQEEYQRVWLYIVEGQGAPLS